jgi:hypothetical protein
MVKYFKVIRRIRMKDQNCAYCMGGELLDKFGIPVCKLEASQLVLFKEQMNPGKTFLSDEEYKEIIDLIKANLE